MEWHSILETVTRKLKATQGLKRNVKREDELVSYLWTDQTIRKLMSEWLESHYHKKECKSVQSAQVFKAIGNMEFQAKEYARSIKSYTECASHAPINSHELSVAIANRSAALFYLNRYDDCLKDIELAIKLNYPKQLHCKIYLRAVQCYLKLGKRDLAEETLSKIHQMMNNPDYIVPSMKGSIEKRISEITFTESCEQSDVTNTSDLDKLKSEIIFNENPDFAHASVNIERKFDSESGRYVITKRHVKKGDILFLEKPVSFVLLNHDSSNYLCQHCNRSNPDVPVPCAGCFNTFYCDAKCLDEAWSSYHRWECPGSQMCLWKEIGLGHLAMKVLLTCTTTMNKFKFNEMQNLLTNFEKLSIEDLTLYGITAVMLTVYLSEYTDFFKINDLDHCLVQKFSDNTFNSNFNIVTEYDKQLYVSSLLLRYILQLICNGHAITTSNTLSNESDASMDQENIVATGIYPSASMMNHSCDPNIISIFVDQYLIVRAAKDIAANEEIFSCYGPHYRYMPRDERQKHLKSHYCFTCKCKPCTVPCILYFLERFSAMKCLRCNGALCNIRNLLYCLDCGDRPRIHYRNEIKLAEKIYESVQESIDSDDIEQALERLKSCLLIRKRVLYKYNTDIMRTLTLIEKIYIAKGQWEESITYLEDKIPAVIERYGPSSVELLNELNNLIDMCIIYLQKQSNTSTDTYKNLLEKTHKYMDQIEDLTNFNYGSWNKIYEATKKKRKEIAIL